MEYDALNRLTKAYTKTKTGEVNSISYTYDALGRVLSVTDELGNTTRMTYDAAGNLISTTDATGVVTETATYDSMGRVNTMKDALGMTTTYTYDTMGNLLQAVRTLNADNSRKTAYAYDTFGRVLSVTDTMQGVTSVTYDKQGNVSSLTDANGGVTEYRYDKMGQLTAEISPLGSKTSYTYNAAGLLTESVNARKQSTKYSYDAVGRITSMTDELGTVTYTYDANGNVLTVTDAQGTIHREYDALNRVTKYTDARGNTVKYGYDELGNMLYLEYPGGEIVRCTYYKNGWLETVTDPAGKVTKYSYDARGNLTHTERPNGTEEICEYNAAGLLTMQKDVRKAAAGEEVLTEYHYSYDAAGNITAITGSETTATKEGIGALASAAMTYDADNKLLTYNGEKIRYDADGNMIYGPVNGVMSELTYDCRNRLVSAGGVTYTYDAENNRIGMASDRHSESYVVDMVSASLSRVLTITDGAGTTTLCIYGQGLICEKTGDIYQYHHYNNLGSTMKLTDADGSVVASFTYGTYGELLSGSTGYTRFLYNGQYGVVTDDNGLYYMRQRYYNPETKRFLNRDILTGSISKSQSLNRYSYVQGNPVNYTDPFGLSPAAQSFKDVGHWHTMLGLLSLIPPVMPYAAGLDALLYAAVDKDPLKAVFFGALSGTATAGKFAVYAAGTSLAKYGKVASQIAKYGEKTVAISGLANSARDVSDDISTINALLENSDGITKEILLKDGKLVVDLALVGLFGGSIGKSNKQISGLEKLYENLEPPYKGGTGVKYSPINPGPLKEEVANSFNGAVYTERVLTEDTVMYRVSGGKAGKIGSYLSMTPQRGGLQSQLDLALNPAWGNTTENVAKVIVPKGTTIYEGIAAPQNIYDSLGNVIGTLPGGGNQVYIPQVEVGWFQ